MMKTIPKIVICLFVICITSTLLMTRCGINFDGDATGEPHEGNKGRSLESVPPSEADCSGQLKKYREEVTAEHVKDVEKVHEDYQAQISALKQTIANLESQVNSARELAADLAKQNSIPSDQFQVQEKYEALKNHFAETIQDTELIEGIKYNNEYEVFAFCRFTLSRIYLLDPGLGKRVIEKPIGKKKKDIQEVVEYGIQQLNIDRHGLPDFTVEDFLEGMYRTEPTLGTSYILFYRDPVQQANVYRQLTVQRPFGPFFKAEDKPVETKKSLINLILPLKGRIDKFHSFMGRFVRTCVKHDKRVFLTVVYFGDEGLKEVKDIIAAVVKEHRFKNMKLVTLNEEFSRGRGLQTGVKAWTQGDVLMFLCDVDVVFSTDFLERCRLNTERGKRVYYPIVFSLYNPAVVYSLQDLAIPNEHEQLVISKDTGFWRDFGYGMTCQYRSDFLSIKGFDEQITGWGMEDVYLYRKYVKSSDYLVVRATDPGIFHIWHEKMCPLDLPSDQYRGCIRSKALNEASHAQLGMLAFRDEIDKHKLVLASKKKGRR